MLVFLDFEASSLSERSYPIEVGWVFADGTNKCHLIRPAPAWTDWAAAAEAIHGVSRQELLANGRSHAAIAQRMVDVLIGHDVCASAPSWDGKWLSVLRAAGLPCRALRLRDTDAALHDTAQAILAPVPAPAALEAAIANLLEASQIGGHRGSSVHRALADAERERQRWVVVQRAAQAAARQTVSTERVF